jgi:hypothetical protein
MDMVRLKNGNQELGRSAGVPTTKIHLLIDDGGNPEIIHLRPGNIHDID